MKIISLFKNFVDSTELEMSVLHKLTYRVNAITIKILAGILMDLNKLILKFIWKSKETRIIKNSSFWLTIYS